MSVTIRTVGIQTTTLPDGSKAVVHFDNTTSAPVIQPEPPDPPINPIPTTGRSVVIEIGGTSHTYNQADGQDMGDYVDPTGRFTQHCTRCTNAGMPNFAVWFRPDADGIREEVVFELGAIWPTTALANLGAYVAYIYKDDVQLARVDVPHHNWHGRWRWQSSVRPLLADVADLISQGMLPHYNMDSGSYTPASASHYYAGPMDLAGITPYMPQTGGRDDIGIVTECQADYICTGSDAALNTLRAQLEGCSTLTWHYRDENTGAPLDTHAYPRASGYDPYNQSPDPYIPLQVGDGGGITLDDAHCPDLAYVPYLLTGDPYALEEMQFTVTYQVIKQPPDSRKNYNMGGALRAHAWALRCMARCARATPDAVPQWLLPRSNFQQMMDGNRDFVAGYATSTETLFQNLNCLADPRWGAPPETNIPPDCSNAPWWEDYEQAVMGHVIEMGFDDWRPNYEWKVRNIIDRCNGTSGWVRNNAFPYKMAVRETAASPFPANWQACWDLNVQMGALTDTGTDHIPVGDIAYPMQGLAALAIAKRLGITGAQEAHAWLQNELDNMLSPSIYIYFRWSIV